MAYFPNAPTPWGNATALGISSPTVVKSTAGVALIAQVLTAGSTAGAVYDSVSTSGNSASDQAAPIPNTVGAFIVNMPCANGIVVSPGTGQVVSLSYA